MEFENLTIGQLKKLTEQYEKLWKENKLLKIKYPTAKLESESGDLTAEELIKELG